MSFLRSGAISRSPASVLSAFSGDVSGKTVPARHYGTVHICVSLGRPILRLYLPMKHWRLAVFTPWGRAPSWVLGRRARAMVTREHRELRAWTAEKRRRVSRTRRQLLTFIYLAAGHGVGSSPCETHQLGAGGAGHCVARRGHDPERIGKHGRRGRTRRCGTRHRRLF